MAHETTPLRIATLTTSNTTCLAAHNGLLYSGATNQIAVFDLTNDFTQIDTLRINDAASGSVKSIAFGPWKIYTAHQDCKIRVWKITRSGPLRHRLMATLPTVKDRLYRIISPGNYVRVRRHRKRLWIEHWDAVSGVVVNGGFVYSVSWDRSFKVWSASDHKCLLSVKAHEDAVNAVAVGKNGVVYTGSADGVIGVWEVKEGKKKKKKYTLVRTLDNHKSTVNAIALNEGGWAMFSGSSDRSIMVWKKEDGGKKISFVEDLWGHQGAVLCLYTLRDLLVSGSEDRTLRIWRGNVTNGYHCTTVMDGHRSPVKSLVLVSVEAGERSLMICSASLDGEILVWSSKL